MASDSEKYVWKEIPGSSHDLLRRRVWRLPKGLRLLDLGAAGGHLGRAVREHCSYLAGVEPDGSLPKEARAGYDDWRAVDALSAGNWDRPFDVVVCADVLEHLPNPEELLQRIRLWLREGGTLLASIPNIANISTRFSLLLGKFGYTERGILDRTHVRFYTRASAKDLLEKSGFRILAVHPTAMPYELAIRVLGREPCRTPARAFAQASARLWPTLFGYQFVLEAVKASAPKR